jgi:nucleoid-associated protein YgaU
MAGSLAITGVAGTRVVAPHGVVAVARPLVGRGGAARRLTVVSARRSGRARPVVGRRAGAAARPASLRWGRVLLVLIVVLAGWGLVGRAAASPDAAGSAAGFVALPSIGADGGTVEVAVGDTLWTIAERLSPGADPRVVLAELVRLNHVDPAGLQVGQVLRVPAIAGR